ncbi:hypothetical protein [Chitinophaga sp.]|uniref:hypothetical protein n=1 Tax=Chitinophaga sp. TaxID=1869181 RepID=UPI0031DF0F60
MKKVKILLSSVAVIAVIAVAVASEARQNLKVYSFDPVANTCTVFVRDHATINPNPATTQLLTTDPTLPCIKADIVPLIND